MASRVPGKHSNTEPHPQHLVCFVVVVNVKSPLQFMQTGEVRWLAQDYTASGCLDYVSEMS